MLFAISVLGETRKTKKSYGSPWLVEVHGAAASLSDCGKECVTDPHACDCGMESIYVSVNMKL